MGTAMHRSEQTGSTGGHHVAPDSPSGLMQADERVAEAYVRLHAASIRLATMLCGDADAGQELAQDVWIGVFRRERRAPIEAFEPYVRRSIVNAVRSRARRRVLERVYVASLRAGTAAGPEGTVPGELLVIEVLQRLPVRARTAIVLRVIEDLSVAETAAAMGVSEGTVKSTVSKGLQRLRMLMGDDHVG